MFWIMQKNTHYITRVFITVVIGLMVWVSTTHAQSDEQIVLQWQTANLTEEQYRPVYEQMIAEFEAAHPNITIEPILVPRQDHWTKFVTAAQAGLAPCVVSVDVATAAYNGYLRLLDDFWNAEPESYRQAWSPDVLQAATWQGELYGLPSWGGIYGEFYNRELVEQAGLDPNNPPETWEEYLDWAKKLTTDDQWATAVLGGPTDTTTRTLLMWIWSNGGEAFNEDMTEATFASNPKSLEAIEFYLGLALDENVAAPGPVTTNYLEQTNLFAQEKLASMRNAYWAFAKVVGDNPEIADKIFVAFPPMNTDDKVTLATLTADSISSDCEHPEAAWEFIKFNNERKWGIQRARIANWMPLRNDLIDDPEVQQDPMLVKFLEFGQHARAYPLPHPSWADISANDIVKAVQAALLEQGTVEEVFTQLDKDLTSKLNDY